MNPRSALYRFGRFELDARSGRLLRDGQPVPVSERYLRILLHLARHAGHIVSKEDLLTVGWDDVAVGDNSLEQAISALRRALGPGPEGHGFIQTVPRQGYRMTAAVDRAVVPEPDETISALLAPHRALIDGRAALETLERDRILQARAVFNSAVAGAPDLAPAHVGLANACVLQFEMTRADEAPDSEALRVAVRHAYEACRLDPDHAEAWATLGFVLARTGNQADALAAARRAILLESDNWRHHFRLATSAWGEERLRAARRTLALLPGFPLAHWMAATVLVARQRLDEAARELEIGIAADSGGASRFGSVALHWLLGLIHMASGDDARALDAFERELAQEGAGHLYARECCANAWYAIGALRLRQGRMAEAAHACAEALQRVRRHPLARLAAAHATGTALPPPHVDPAAGGGGQSMDDLLCAAAARVLAGSHAEAARLVAAALGAAPPGGAGWLLPVEPLIGVRADPQAWGPALATLRTRAA